MKRKAAALAALALISGGIFATTSASAGAAQSGFQISSRYNNRCLSVGDHVVGNAMGVIMIDCQGHATQKWNWDNLRLRNVYTNKCLTVAWGNAENGAALHMFDCQPNWASQTFYRPASRPEEVGRLRSWLPGNRCIEIAGGNWWQGASVQLWDCHTGGNHYWNAP